MVHAYACEITLPSFIISKKKLFCSLNKGLGKPGSSNTTLFASQTHY